MERVEGVRLTPEPNKVAFVQRIENARTFKINPLEEIVVTVPSEKAKHEFCLVEHRSAPNAAPPLHLHRNEDEIFEILEGQFRFWLDREIVEASPRYYRGGSPQWHPHLEKRCRGARTDVRIAMDAEILDRHTRSYPLHALRRRHPGGRRICRRHALGYRPDLLLSRCDHQQARTEILDRQGAQHGHTSQHPCRSAEMRDEFCKALVQEWMRIDLQRSKTHLL